MSECDGDLATGPIEKFCGDGGRTNGGPPASLFKAPLPTVDDYMLREVELSVVSV